MSQTTLPAVATQSPALLITGAPGWLGDAVLAELLGSGQRKSFRIKALIQRGLTPERLMTWRLKYPLVSESISGDMCDSDSLRAACAELKGGSVLHMAGIIHPRRSGDWYRINRDGSVALATLAKAAGVRRFVFVSSNAAQGRSLSAATPLTEDMPSRPCSHYGKSKYQAEQALRALHTPGEFEVVIARPCMFYGPPVPARHVDVFKRVREGWMPLVGGGQFARSVSYIEDLARGIILCLSHPRAAGEVFNLCDERIYTTLEICEAMAAALKVKPRYVRVPGLTGSVAYGLDSAVAALGLYWQNMHLLGESNWNVGCSCRKAVELLGYKTSVDVSEGYRRAVAWCQQQKLL